MTTRTPDEQRLIEAHRMFRSGDREGAIALLNALVATTRERVVKNAAMRALTVYERPRRSYEIAKQIVEANPEEAISWAGLSVTAKRCGFNRVEETAKKKWHELEREETRSDDE